MFSKISDIQTDLTKQATGQNTSSWTCPSCGAIDETQYLLQIIYSGKTENWFPKYIPQIKESCLQCGHYRRFHRQTDQLITRINERLEKIPIKSNGWRDGV